VADTELQLEPLEGVHVVMPSVGTSPVMGLLKTYLELLVLTVLSVNVHPGAAVTVWVLYP